MGLTISAMLAFAANSLLCRFALGGDLIDAASFTSLRVLSGALLLYWLLQRDRAPPEGRTRLDWIAAASLFVYLVGFSFAYIALQTGTGALILFGTVQLTMFAAAFNAGERFSSSSWTGFAVAVGGMLYLLAPGVTAPPLGGSLLMSAAGIAWGVYSLRGRRARNALRSTARNFAAAVPLVLAVNAVYADAAHFTSAGVLAALASGTIASALGYVLWYRALTRLSAMSASTVQLAVPIIAAAGGVALLGEQLTARLVVASAAVLGGVALAIARRPAKPAPAEELKAP